MSEHGRVLIVDDSAGNRALLTKLLEPQGYIVQSAANGRDALAILANQPIDVVLLDFVMPEMDGLAVLKIIQIDVRMREIPVLIVSAYYEAAQIAACIEQGAVDYITKPFERVILSSACACVSSGDARG